MGQYGRRKFIKHFLFTAGAALLAPHVNARVRGANNDVRIAIVGLRKKGKEHIKSFGSMPGARAVALCDCDTQFLDSEARQLDRARWAMGR